MRRPRAELFYIANDQSIHSLETLFAVIISLFSISAQAQLLLNEIVVNPPGADEPLEFIELKGTPGTTLNKIYVCVFEGDSASAGNCDLVIPLNNVTIGTNGLLFIGTTLGYGSLPAATTVKDTLCFGIPGGILENGNTTFTVLFSPIPIVYNADYDTNNDGVLDLPNGAVLQDAVGWTNGDLTAKIYGGVTLTQSAGTPDAASRIYGNTTAFSKPAWYNGDLTTGTAYDLLKISANFPTGGTVTPGNHNAPNSVGLENVSDLNLVLYPNPAPFSFSIVGLKNDCPFTLLDVAGRAAHQGVTQNGRVSLPEGVSSGLYFVQLTYQGKLLSKRIILAN